MTRAAPFAQAESYLAKADEYLVSAEDNLAAERFTVAAGDAIHAGICATDAIVMRLTGRACDAEGQAASELEKVLGRRDVTVAAERAIRGLVGLRGQVEHGAEATAPARARQAVRHARTLVCAAADVMPPARIWAANPVRPLGRG